jgi:hypothetical protein
LDLPRREGDLLDWRAFRDLTVAAAEKRGDEGFLRYAGGVSDKTWAHILAEDSFTPLEAEERLWSFYRRDILGHEDVEGL